MKSYHWPWVNRCKVITSSEETPLSPAHTRRNLYLRRDTRPESTTLLVWNISPMFYSSKLQQNYLVYLSLLLERHWMTWMWKMRKIFVIVLTNDGKNHCWSVEQSITSASFQMNWHPIILLQCSTIHFLVPSFRVIWLMLVLFQTVVILNV